MKKFIIIYGPPAAGKLTVAKELAKLIKFKIFHNHAINDVVNDMIDFEHPRFWKISDQLKVHAVDLAAKYTDENLIYTGVYGGKSKIFERLKHAFEKHGGKVYFVRLEPERKVLIKRVKAASRKKYRKLKSKTKLLGSINKYNAYSKLPYRNQIAIDNTKISAKEVAKIIVERFKLR